jgi:5-methylcytosine-specific restriction endonuclease McrA
MKRQAVTPNMKLNCLLERANIRCSECGGRITPYCVIEWDHIQALVHGGEHSYLNLRPLHIVCHAAKTVRDIQANAKVKRLANPKPSKRPMAGGKQSKFKRKMNGTVERRS